MKLQIGIDGKKYEVEVEVIEDDTAPRLPNFGPYPAVPSTLQSAPAATAPPAAAEDKQDDGKVCRSPVAGVVIKVNVQAGKEIQADELMIILEAMKMETNITAPWAGKVKSVRVKEGEAVKANQVVVEFE